MLSTRVFRPTMMAGIVYAREVGSTQPLQPIGGVEEFTLAIDEAKINQTNTSTSGGGNRATVYRINELTMTAKLQDLNPVNLARGLRSAHAEVVAGTVVDEQAGNAKAGGLTRLAHLQPSTVVVRGAGGSTVISAANYEVRPEGLFFYDDAPAIVADKASWVTANPTLDADDYPGMPIEVDYAHSGYDVIQALTAASPLLELTFSGVNEALENAPSVVDIWRVQLSATKGLNLISAGEFATLDIEGEVLQDPTKTGVGVSKYFRKQMLTPA